MIHMIYMIYMIIINLTHVCDGQERVREELHAAGLVPTAQQPQPRDLQFAGDKLF